VLAAASSVTMQPENIFSQLSNGDLPYPSLTLSDGTVIERLDYAAYSRYRQVPNREDRKKVFDAFWGAWKQYEGTFGTMLSAQIKANEFTTSQRKFPNALAQALFSDNMPEAVYRQLVAQANAGLPVFHRYLRMRAKLLGIDGPLAYYDIYPSMFELEEEQRFSVEDAKAITLEVTSAYGPEYTAMLRRGFESNWMNVLPRPGKASAPTWRARPTTYTPTCCSTTITTTTPSLTFAHEWGHAVHTLLTNATQPFEKADYSTFIAETASIANEMLLNDYMVAHAKTKAEKLYYLGRNWN
jgi:oligoendopeptidase F